MNIKRGLKRLWVVGTVLWVVGVCSLFYEDLIDVRFSLDILGPLIWVPLFCWMLLYMGFWVSSGFSSDKKKDETNE
jgi:hypothetical protein